MLISYSVENYRSIKNRVTLELSRRAAIKEFAENVIAAPIERVGDLLRTAVIYGYNSSGKSNLLRSAFTLRNFILTGHSATHGDKIPVEPFLFDDVSAQKPTTFEIEFIHLDIRYSYTCSMNTDRVVEEVLAAYPKGAKQTWFKRKYSDKNKQYDWDFGPHFKGEKDSIKNRTLENTLFFSKAAQENHDLIKPLTEFFRDYFYISPNGDGEMLTLDMLETEHGKERILSLLRAAELGIDDLEANSGELTDDDFPNFLPEEVKQKIRKEARKWDIQSVHLVPGTNRRVLLDFEDHESSGAIKVFGLAGLIIKTLENGSILFIDELERNLHCKLVCFLINLFNCPKWNSKNAQLIFTTHSPTTLDTNNFRRDQIWFTDKTSEKNTILFNAIDVGKIYKDKKPPRRQHSMSKSILEGKFYKPPVLDGLQLTLFSDDYEY